MTTPQEDNTKPRAWNSQSACFFCIGSRLQRVLELRQLSDAQRQEFVGSMAQRYAQGGAQLTGVAFIRDLYRELNRRYPADESLWAHKKRMNDVALDLQSVLKVRVRMANNAFHTALRIALAATAIDFLEATRDQILAMLDSLMVAPLGIDHSAELRAMLKGRKRLLYLADQAGEIVFDRVFIRSLSGQEVTYVVNDSQAGLAASGQDADYVDMRHCARVLSNGCNAPHTDPAFANARFQEEFSRADVIIAKGQANLESFYDLHDPRVFSLFTCRCEHSANAFRIRTGDTALMNIEQRLREVYG